jgi:hypothetical protein
MTALSIALFLDFWGNSMLISIGASLICIPTHSGLKFLDSCHPQSSPAFVVFFMTAILTRVRGNLNALLTYISFITNHVEHFFMFLLAICTFFLRTVSSIHLIVY